MRTYLRTRVEGYITEVNPGYKGSLTLGSIYMDKGFDEGEQIYVLNVANGERFITYVMKGTGNQMVLNGACARKGLPGDKVIILAYEIR